VPREAAAQVTLLWSLPCQMSSLANLSHKQRGRLVLIEGTISRHMIMSKRDRAWRRGMEG
jgi:hypothetical protein